MKEERDKAAKVAEAARIEAEAARAALAKAEEAKRAEVAAIEAAALAPDKEKLAFLVTQIAGINIPKLETPQAARITDGVKTLLGKVRAYIEQEADKL
jgi:vacuolar-type H+-ATPase subunit D/Vma8